MRLKAVARMLAVTGCVMTCMTGTLCVTGCSEGKSPAEPTVTESTDTAVAARLFPGLDGVESIQVTQYRYGGSESSFSLLPAPCDYRYEGHVTISETMADEYLKSYDFDQEHSKYLRHSHEFCKAIIKDGLIGDVWLNEDGTTISFSIGMI